MITEDILTKCWHNIHKIIRSRVDNKQYEESIAEHSKYITPEAQLFCLLYKKFTERHPKKLYTVFLEQAAQTIYDDTNIDTYGALTFTYKDEDYVVNNLDFACFLKIQVNKYAGILQNIDVENLIPIFVYNFARLIHLPAIVTDFFQKEHYIFKYFGPYFLSKSSFLKIADTSESRVLVSKYVEEGNISEAVKIERIKKKLNGKSLVNINYQDNYGATALMKAESLEMIEFLLSYGADPNICNKFDETALHVLSFGADILIKYGANIDKQNNNKETALDIIAQDYSALCPKEYLKNLREKACHILTAKFYTIKDFFKHLLKTGSKELILDILNDKQHLLSHLDIYGNGLLHYAINAIHEAKPNEKEKYRQILLGIIEKFDIVIDQKHPNNFSDIPRLIKELEIYQFIEENPFVSTQSTAKSQEIKMQSAPIEYAAFVHSFDLVKQMIETYINKPKTVFISNDLYNKINEFANSHFYSIHLPLPYLDANDLLEFLSKPSEFISLPQIKQVQQKISID